MGKDLVPGEYLINENKEKEEEKRKQEEIENEYKAYQKRRDM